MNYPPDHCPYCGTVLEAVEPPTAHHCPDCEEYVFYNPTPSARVVVLDRDGRHAGGANGAGDGHATDTPDERVLLVTRPDGVWITPGGAIDANNQPREHAARELQEEANLTVAPDTLRFCRTATTEVHPDRHAVSLTFAVDAAAVSGDLRAGSDAGQARFWTVREFENDPGARFREMHRDRTGYEDLGGWVAAAREVLS